MEATYVTVQENVPDFQKSSNGNMITTVISGAIRKKVSTTYVRRIEIVPNGYKGRSLGSRVTIATTAEI